MRASQMKTINILLSRNLLNTLWNCRTSWTIWCADPCLISRCAAISFTVTRQFSFTMAFNCCSGLWCHYSVCLTGSRRVYYRTTTVHSYICCSDRHASPYWTFIRRWISMGITPSLLKKTDHRTLFFFGHVASGAAIFTLLLRRRVAFLHRTATCRPLYKPSVSLLSTYRQSSCGLNCYRTFRAFIWPSLVFI